MATVAIDREASPVGRGKLFVSTACSPSKAVALGLSPISTAKQTETPRKLKALSDDINSKHDNNNDEDDASVHPGFTRSGSWNSRAAFSPRPKRSNNPARRPVQSVSSIRALRMVGDDENAKSAGDESKVELSNQCQLERIQEADNSDEETENDSLEEADDEYDGDGEEDDALQLYKSFSGDLTVRYDAPARRARTTFDDDDDIVRI